MRRILSIHQNLPGQFRGLMRCLQTRPDVELAAIGEEAALARTRMALQSGSKLRTIAYPKPEYPAAFDDRLRIRIKNSVDWSRVHLLGKLPYASYRTVLQVSSLHIYLTYPFVLSWSMLEAMAVGVPVLGSDTGPAARARDGTAPLRCRIGRLAGLPGAAEATAAGT